MILFYIFKIILIVIYFETNLTLEYRISFILKPQFYGFYAKACKEKYDGKHF